MLLLWAIEHWGTHPRNEAHGHSEDEPGINFPILAACSDSSFGYERCEVTFPSTRPLSLREISDPGAHMQTSGAEFLGSDLSFRNVRYYEAYLSVLGYMLPAGGVRSSDGCTPSSDYDVTE